MIKFTPWKRIFPIATNRRVVIFGNSYVNDWPTYMEYHHILLRFESARSGRFDISSLYPDNISTYNFVSQQMCFRTFDPNNG